jgi:drug/metabolite transporter (DMT)-like permease
LMVGLSGVVVLLFTRTTGLSPNPAGFDFRGYALALISVLSIAIAVVYTRKHLRQVDVLVVTAGQMFVGLLVIAPFGVLFAEINLSRISWQGWAAVLYTGLIGSYVVFILFFSMVRRYGATTASLPGYVTPVVTFGLGSLLLGELITGSLIAGAALALAGVFLSSR